MKDLYDTSTKDLLGPSEAVKKVGRPPLFGRPMTDAERKHRQREKEANQPKALER
jgi:hypothetical protein